jgi:hypothetical protein
MAPSSRLDDLVDGVVEHVGMLDVRGGRRDPPRYGTLPP